MCVYIFSDLATSRQQTNIPQLHEDENVYYPWCNAYDIWYHSQCL